MAVIDSNSIEQKKVINGSTISGYWLPLSTLNLTLEPSHPANAGMAVKWKGAAVLLLIFHDLSFDKRDSKMDVDFSIDGT